MNRDPHLAPVTGRVRRAGDQAAGAHPRRGPRHPLPGARLRRDARPRRRARTTLLTMRRTYPCPVACRSRTSDVQAVRGGGPYDVTVTSPTLSPTRTWSAVLFDLDGTIVDSATDIMASLAHAFTEMGLARPRRRRAALLRRPAPARQPAHDGRLHRRRGLGGAQRLPRPLRRAPALVARLPRRRRSARAAARRRRPDRPRDLEARVDGARGARPQRPHQVLHRRSPARAKTRSAAPRPTSSRRRCAACRPPASTPTTR